MILRRRLQNAPVLLFGRRNLSARPVEHYGEHDRCVRGRCPIGERRTIRDVDENEVPTAPRQGFVEFRWTCDGGRPVASPAQRRVEGNIAEGLRKVQSRIRVYKDRCRRTRGCGTLETCATAAHEEFLAARQ